MSKKVNIVKDRFNSVLINPLPDTFIKYIIGLYRNINSKIDGRMGITLDDAILMAAIIYHGQDVLPNNSSSAFVEIGTMHGGTAIFVRKVMDYVGNTNQIVISIDPLSGFYDMSDKDPNTGVVVDKDVYESNLKKFNIELGKDCILLQGLSQDGSIIDNIRRYNVLYLFIDGDHSYEAVMRDWSNYSDMVVPDGFVMMHDYIMKTLPEKRLDYYKKAGYHGTKQFVHDYVVDNPNWVQYGRTGPANMYTTRRMNDVN